jgi:hypothetical protein
MNLGNDCFLTWMRTGGQPNRASGQGGRQACKFVDVDREVGSCEFQVAWNLHTGCTQRLESCCIVLAARIDVVKCS